MEGIVHHKRCSFLGDLLVGRIQCDEVDVRAHQLVQEGIDGRNGCFIQSGKQHLNIAFASQPRVEHALFTMTNRRRSGLTESMTDAGFQLRSGFPGERDGRHLGGQQARPRCEVGAFSFGSAQGAMTRERHSWTGGCNMGGALVARKEVLHVAFRHHGGFSSSSTCIQGNVSVQIQTQSLTGVEVNGHKPPSRSVDAPHEWAMGQYWQCLPGVGLMCP